MGFCASLRAFSWMLKCGVFQAGPTFGYAHAPMAGCWPRGASGQTRPFRILTLPKVTLYLGHLPPLLGLQHVKPQVKRVKRGGHLGQKVGVVEGKGQVILGAFLQPSPGEKLSPKRLQLT